MKFSRRAQRTTRSAIGQMLAAANGKSCISFAGGLPDESLFPCRELGEIMKEVVAGQGEQILRYSDTAGSARLREQISRRMAQLHKGCVDKEQIIITNGSQQGIDLAGRAFLDEGDMVLIESPSYVDALNVFKSYGAELKAVPSDKDGMIPEALEAILAENSRIKFIYVITDFQNPTGKRWSLARRKALMELADRYDVAVIDDAPYSELNYDKEELPSLLELDTQGRTIFLGSFSKTLAPGMRIGWLAAGKELISLFTVLKEGADIHSANPTQEAAAEYMSRYDMNDHVAAICKVYKARRDAMDSALHQYFPKQAKWVKPAGGFFFWVELPETINATEKISSAIENGVVYVPGTAFYAEGGNHHTLRLNFTHMSEEDIDRGIRVLGKLFSE